MLLAQTHRKFLFLERRAVMRLHSALHHQPVRPSSSTPPKEGPRVAVIGSGPSGLYVCARLLQRLPSCRIDVFDRAQAPYGLIFYGVAPDHVDMKKSMNSFERMFSDNRDRIALFCNVDVNRDVTYPELCARYEAVVLAYGASKARQLGIAGERAANCLSGSTFVSWYNGAPLHNISAPLLDQEDAVIVGNGNVAIDCSRILLSDPQRLASTDITEQALRSLRQSRVRRVHVLGRRGPQNCSFTIKELRELLALPGVNSHCAIPTEQYEKLKAEMTQMERPKQRLLKLMLDYADNERRRKVESNKSSGKILQLDFHRRPEAIEMDSAGRISTLRVRNTMSDAIEDFPCGLLIYAIGFEHVLLNGVPVAADGRLAMLDWCRVPSEQGAAQVYATGWCSHAARGLIADSQQQAYAVADQLAEDWEGGRIGERTTEGAETELEVEHLLESRGVPYISWDDWRYIDECERRMGAILGKSREKIADATSILKIMLGRH